MSRIWAGARERIFRGASPPWLLRWHDGEFGRLVASAAKSAIPDGFHVRWAGPEDFGVLGQIRDRPSSFAKLFGRGHRCVIGFQGDDPVSMNWLAGKQVHISTANAFTFDVGPDGAWSFGDFVRADRRRRGYFGAHLRALMRLLGDEGRTKLYCAMFHEDRRSVGAHVKAGYEILARLRTARLLGVTVYLLDDYRAGSRTLGAGTWKGQA